MHFVSEIAAAINCFTVNYYLFPRPLRIYTHPQTRKMLIIVFDSSTKVAPVCGLHVLAVLMVSLSGNESIPKQINWQFRKVQRNRNELILRVQ